MKRFRLLTLLALLFLGAGHAFAQNPGTTAGRLDVAGLSSTIEDAIRLGDHIRFEQLSMEYLGRGKHTALEYLNMQRRFTEMWGDQKGFFRRVEVMVNRYAWGDASLLNNAAWHVYEVVADRHALKKAQDWAEESIYLDPGYYNHDTYAMLSAKLGQHKRAVIFARTAVLLARMNGEDCRETEMALAGMTRGGPHR